MAIHVLYKVKNKELTSKRFHTNGKASIWNIMRFSDCTVKIFFQFGYFLTGSPGLPDISPYPYSTGLEIQWDLKFSQAPGAVL